jgi:hypothetical protein
MNQAIEPLERRAFDVASLMAEHPPRLRNRKKQILLEIAFPGGARASGMLQYTRWPALPLPACLGRPDRLRVLAREDIYDYAPLAPVAGDPPTEWHVNFADPRLFIAYGSGLFAQDEMQVAEHPVLGSLREALEASSGRPPMTVAPDGSPTPVLVRGAERRVAVAIDPDFDAGRPYGLYGNRFAAATPEVIERAARRIDPPTITNLIAIAAPSGGCGTYRRDEIERVLVTAYTGFAAAVHESPAPSTAIHTGFWGCGAFGGNRDLMAIAQLLAARLAGVETLVFHTVNREGARIFGEAQRAYDREFAATEIATETAVGRLLALGFKWGESDGN